MGDSRDLCPHLDSVGEVTKEDLLLKSKAKKHNLTVNLTTFRVWCYACEKEVFLEPRLAAQPPGPSPKFSEQARHIQGAEQPLKEAGGFPHSGSRTQDSALPSHPLKAVPIAVADEGESECSPSPSSVCAGLPGLTGMKNLGNSCYMNAALQALSNCPPLTQFFLECGGLVRTDKKPALCKSYQKLVSEVWHRKRPSYVVPTSLSHGIKLVNPMFRGYAQQDTQEFLRCLMDQLHEELKEPVVAAAAALTEARDSDSSDTDEKREGDRSPSEDEFLSCDSSSDREPDNEAHMRSASRPCSPVHHHEGHAKLAGSPPHRPVSTTVETFQDLSLPIPGKEDLAKLHSAIYQNVPAKPGACGDSSAAQGWLAFIVEYIRRFVVSCTPSWFWGPVVTLEDCLAAFFAADELKGPRQVTRGPRALASPGVTGTSPLSPQILCIHLKRFRHEVMYSFKISSHVSFPLEGLDLRPFLAKECTSQITTYDLLSVICHHGTAGIVGLLAAGHPDQCLSPAPCLAQGAGGVCCLGPSRFKSVKTQSMFGGGPAVNHLYVCSICQVEIEALAKRRRIEIDTFIKLNKAFQAEESPSVIYCISMQWFREWEAFVKGKDNEPPGPIDNSRIAQVKGSGHIQLKQGADYGQISEETWVYLNNLYGGGPEIALRQSVAQLQDPESLHGEQKIEAETRAV
ncbi:hypothetical protein E2I00_004274 [Balaenoptera physalus]|uniref:Ubiquitin carboxyl-terminal hydrolase 20 n=1 Tax=Balaenoptera physalus TaxID=9770 RepID=A0A6A1QG93_BALPH|nr:hypothetical protein E2I00_004274 [Balaenoptera physalus]